MLARDVYDHTRKWKQSLLQEKTDVKTFESRCNTDAEYMMRHVWLQDMSMTSQGSETKLVIREDRPEHS